MNPTFPPPLAELLEAFADMPDWDDRYEYIIDLGRQLPEGDATLQTNENKVRGCMSTVWMLAHVEGDRPPRMKIIADSDSQIVRGLIVILLSLYQGRTPTEVLEIDAEKTLAQLGLAQHLSPNRRNGLFAMVKHIRVLAAGQLAARTNPAGASS